MSRPIFFQAAHLTDQESIDQFTVRQRELDTLLTEIRRDDMSGSIQHYVIIGQRGSGKSTLLRRVEAAVHSESDLSARLVAVNLSEEQAGIYRLHDLWDRTGEELRERGLHVEPVDWGRFEDDRPALARASYHALQKGLQKAGKKLVLLLDNIDRIFKNLDKEEASLFRELLINHNDLRIVGGSTMLSEHHWKYDQPFYEFFHLMRLEALTLDEMRALLTAWADRLQLPQVRMFAEGQDGRLEALRILSDGMPRTMLHLVDLISQRPNEDSYSYLLYIVDKASAIYQERLGTLSPHQQKVLLELSFFWEAASAGQLKETARMDAKTISAALNKLTEMRYVETIPGKGKNHLYRVKERFFNLWLIMTQGGPRQKRRMKYLTIFLEIWYGRDGLARYATEYRERLKQGDVDAGHAAVITPALARSSFISADDRDELIEHTRPLVSKRKELCDFLPSTSSEAYKKAIELLCENKFAEAQNELNDLEQETAYKDMLLAWAEGGLGRTQRSKELIDRALSLDGNGGLLSMAGFTCILTKQHDAAEVYYLHAIDQGDVHALFNLANLYANTGKPEQAEVYYLRAIDQGLTYGLSNLADLYKDMGKLEQAETYYLRAIDQGYVRSLFNLALLDYERQQPSIRAIELLDRYMGLANGLRVRERCLKAVLLTWAGRPEEAEPLATLIRDLLAPDGGPDSAFWIQQFIIHHRTNEVWVCFTGKELGEVMKEQLQPLYYATAKLVGKAGEDAVRVMPTELASTVDAILQDIQHERSLFYPPTK